jgi:gamma-glutamylcyclotransferase (GGCT)/AIG2-like uncharacterized protein YtfP
MNKVAVYGSLRKGLGNHRVLGESKLIGKEWIPNYEMFSLGSFPGIRDGKGAIYVEIYEVDSDTLERLDTLEGYHAKNSVNNFYDKEEVSTKFGDALIYTLQGERYKRSPIVSSGNWKAHSVTLKELI